MFPKGVWIATLAKILKNQKSLFEFLVLIFTSFLISDSLMAQETTPATPTGQFGGVITATNNGVSFIPSFTLGKPAVLFDLTLSGKRFSFDPGLRFGMDGKPWNFTFFGRYKAIKDKPFTLSLGGGPVFAFQKRLVKVNGKEVEMLVNQQFLIMELVPTYKISPKVSIGLYYLQGHGFNPVPPNRLNFLSLNTTISKLPIGKNLNLKINPQLFYLDVENSRGTYFTSNFTVTKPGFPIGFQTQFTQELNSEIPGDDFLWNVSLLYSFSTPFQKVK